MAKNIDELKMIIELAHKEGMKQAQLETLQGTVKDLEKKLEQMEKDKQRLEEEGKRLRNELAEKARENDEQKARIRDLEGMTASISAIDGTGPGKVVVVNNYYLMLSWPKTVDYMGGLDADHRMFAGHMIHHTLPDGTPLQIHTMVDEATRLENLQEKRMADAMEEMAKHPATENHYHGDIVEGDKVDKAEINVTCPGNQIIQQQKNDYNKEEVSHGE